MGRFECQAAAGCPYGNDGGGYNAEGDSEEERSGTLWAEIAVPCEGDCDTTQCQRGNAEER